MDSDTLVSLADIADMAGVSRPAVSNWRRRYPDFPSPQEETGATSLFRLAELQQWMNRHGKRLDVPSAVQLVWSALNRTRGAALPEEAAETGLIVVGYLALATQLGADISRFNSALLDHPEALAHLLERLAFDAERLGLRETFMRETRLPSWAGRRPFLAEILDLVQTFGTGEVFEALLAAGSRGSRGRNEYTTPSSIAALITSLATPIGGLVYDPACGQGTLLLAASQKARTQITLVGQDANSRACLIAQLRMLVHGVSASIVNNDTLGERFPFVDAQADLVVADPPFGMSWRPEVSRLHYELPFGAPPASRADMAWVQSGILSLKPGGVAMFVLPLGSLFRGGSEGAIRRHLIESHCVHAIIALPPAMYSTTSIPVALWVIGRPDEQGTNDVLLIDASQLGYRNRSRTELSEADVAAIDGCFRTWRASGQATIPDGARAIAVPIPALVESGGLLNPERWMSSPGDEPSQLLQRATSAKSELDAASAAFTRASFPTPRLKAENRATGDLAPIHKVSEFATLIRPRRIDPDAIGTGTTPLIRSKDLGPDLAITPSGRVDLTLVPFAVEITRPGDVIAITDGSLPRACADLAGGAAVSAPLQILRPRTESIDPVVLAALVSCISPSYAVGTSIKHVDLAEVEVPYPSPDVARWLKDTLDALGEQRRQATAAVNAIDELRIALVLGLSSNSLKMTPEASNEEER